MNQRVGWWQIKPCVTGQSEDCLNFQMKDDDLMKLDAGGRRENSKGSDPDEDVDGWRNWRVDDSGPDSWDERDAACGQVTAHACPLC